jgi:hypothetical protein
MSLLDSRWACSAGCLEAAALARLEHLCAIRIPAPQHRVPLGLLMLSRGYIDEQQLQTVLITQRDAGGGKLGSWALKLQFVTERQLLNALSLQRSCPVLALQTPPDFACVELLPWTLLRSLRVTPLRFVRSTRLLYLAVCEGIEHTSLAAIERILHCRVVPCLVTDREVDRWLESESRTKAPRVLVFDKTSGATEMAQVTSSYAIRLGADEVQIVRCGSYGWVRLAVANTNSDLLFKMCGMSSDRGSRSADEFAAVG